MKEKMGRIISNILNPFLVCTVMCIILAIEATNHIADAIKWIAITVAVSVVPVFAVVIYLVRRKKLDSIFINPREKRTIIYLLASVLAGVGCFILYYLDAPELMLASFLAGLVAVVIFTVINLYWKISLHTAFMSGSSTILTIVYGIPGALTILLLILLGWSRMQLKLHTLSQVVVGALLPAVVVVVTFWGFGLIG